MAQMRRPIELKFHVTPEEKAVIDKKKAQLGTSCTAAYCRKMAIDGYVLKLDLPEMREMISLLRRYSNNLNQLAKRANATNRVYDTDIQEVLESQERLWGAANDILTKLASLG